MRTLAIRNGDLVVAPGGYEMVEGAAKVKQDLAVALREPYGVDRFHPRWGTVLAEYVGQTVDLSSEMLIRAEVGRVIRNYTTTQGEAMLRESSREGRNSFATSELVASIQEVQVRQNYDSFSIRIFISTVAGEMVTLTRTVA